VAKNKLFRPCRKNSVLDQKMIDYCHDVLYQHAKFGEKQLRTPSEGAKIGVFSIEGKN